MNQKINYSGELMLISNATQRANAILQNEEFHVKLAAKESFDESNASGKNISDLIKGTSVRAQVEIYKSLWLWSKSNAYTTPIQPNIIYLNSRKIEVRSDKDWTCTLIHEFIHLVDFESAQYFFAHGSNRRINKENTAPYWIDNLVQTLLMKL